MGSSLSQQEDLFLRRQWAELLQLAMTSDMDAMVAAAGGETTDAGESTEAAQTTTPRATKKKDGFRLSFQEWQAFLSVLEQKDASGATSGPSDIAARLSATQLHVPVVSLMVHVCVWWRGAITATVLGERVERLVALVDGIQQARVEGAEDKATPLPASQDAPTSRRARLARFVKTKVVDEAKRRTGTAASASASAASAAEQVLMDTFADMLCLVHQLLSSGDEYAGTSGGALEIRRHAAEVFEAYNQKIGDTALLCQRPVLAVVMVMMLAVYAARVTAQPLFAARSVAQLEGLEEMMLRSSASPAVAPVSSLKGLWPIVGELEVELVHRQHEADVVQCLSEEGDALMKTLREMRQSREQLRRDAQAAAASHVPLSPSERWAAGASQYIGQRPIWAQLRSHFLSAGVFDADKPTVLVFFGPSGYGKSELAKRVASVLHDCPMSELESSGKMVYIHMPSFCTKDSIYSLVDPPAAHVGSGILLSALQKHPDAVVVLDEFEKSTAESINNLWLSAFQKNGVLRSLKEASRSVSTVRTTFILTCNTAAEAIAARESLYLNASPADQEKIRGLFVTQCKDVCRETMGDPFVNRVDYFFPFMPHTRAERRRFVCLLLERLLASQAEKGRHLYATPRFVDAMVDQLRTFHAATLEEAVRSQVMRMARLGWSAAVLTVERRMGATVMVLLPASHTAASTSQQTTSTSALDNKDDDVFACQSLAQESWDSLPGGAQLVEKWTVASSAIEAKATETARGGAAESRSPPAAKTASATVEGPRDASVARAEPLPSPSPPLPSPHSSPSPQQVPPHAQQQQQRTPTSPALEKEYEREYVVEKERIVELEKELEKTRALLKQRDLEIVTLKEKIMLLQKVLAVVVLALLSCLCCMALIVGLKLTMLFALATLGVIVLVLGVPLTVILEALRALFQVLGPFKAGVLLVLVLAWIAKSSKSAFSCA